MNPENASFHFPIFLFSFLGTEDRTLRKQLCPCEKQKPPYQPKNDPSGPCPTPKWSHPRETIDPPSCLAVFSVRR